MNKLHEWINTAGIIAVIILVLVGGNQSGHKLGAEGDSNMTNLVLSGTLAVTGVTTHTGATNLTATTTAANLYVGKEILGGVVTTITAAPTTTLTAAQVCSTATDFEFAPTVVSASFTMPVATSTFATCATATGNGIVLYVRNTSSTDATGFVIASSTGTVVRSASSSASFNVTSSTPARLTFKQTGTSTLQIYVDKYTVISP